MAASTVVVLPTVVLFAVFQRQIMDSIKTSGLEVTAGKDNTA